MNDQRYDPDNPHIKTYTGKKFYFLDFGPDDICIEDIAHALANTCRFHGHCHQFYSVAEHSLRVSQQGDSWESKMWGLFHDAAEAYTGDLASPFKHLVRVQKDNRSLITSSLRTYEKNLLQTIRKKFCLPPIPPDVMAIDRHLLGVEIGELWNEEGAPKITMSPVDAERSFVYRYRRLKNMWPEEYPCE